ncbi:hypothetical protein SARC_01731 [Sphaeroforma arctica JP610]|uniref:Uncharacterized protein n=1 Tax=Sphaeroforma arctica JP610 TaxID=667725 RepID=A0A0L0GAV8_9EUKA|nr:hypothetical protein SARC_01731 [Sphaeroforma arctica JP610]KNC86115.1 hypothetical protein SARC_01731 [Sphaeroforma arctica JP610]|eukprot:XP_014160017.1 hypothetical protein SARC_01731 [Sphaeroforma arctica JP610]
MVCPIRVGCTALVASICALSLYCAYNPKKEELAEGEAENPAANELRSGTDSLVVRLMADVGVKLEYYRHLVIFFLVIFHVELITQGAICRYLFVNNPSIASEGLETVENHWYGLNYFSAILMNLVKG